MRAQTARPGGAGNAAPHAGSSRPSAVGGIPVASAQKRRREKERAESASPAQGPRGDSAPDAAWAERAGRLVKSLNSIGSFRWQLISLEVSTPLARVLPLKFRNQWSPDLRMFSMWDLLHAVTCASPVFCSILALSRFASRRPRQFVMRH